MTFTMYSFSLSGPENKLITPSLMMEMMLIVSLLL